MTASGTSRSVAPHVSVVPLADHPGLVDTVAAWFESAWPAYYCTGGAPRAIDDARAFAQRDRLPLGVIAFVGDVPCGVAALKAESIPSHRHLSPWAGAGYVVPERRGLGIGAALLSALEVHAQALGFTTLYCATATAASLLDRCGWRRLEDATHEGRDLPVFARELARRATP